MNEPELTKILFYDDVYRLWNIHGTKGKGHISPLDWIEWMVKEKSTARINLQEFARLEIYDGEALLFFAEGKPDSVAVEDKADGTKTVSLVFKWGNPADGLPENRTP